MQENKEKAQLGKPLHEGRRLEASRLITERFPIQAIREKSIANLNRWKSQGTWNSAYAEWLQLMTTGSDNEIIAVMTGENQNSTRMHASMPYVGLLDLETVWALKKKWSKFPLDDHPGLKEAFFNGKF